MIVDIAKMVEKLIHYRSELNEQVDRHDQQ